MGTFQEKLINNDFELIASELFSDDPGLQLENLKVGFQTTRFISAKHKKFSRHCETFFNTEINEGFDIVERHRWPSTFRHRWDVGVK